MRLTQAQIFYRKYLALRRNCVGRAREAMQPTSSSCDASDRYAISPLLFRNSSESFSCRTCSSTLFALLF